MILSPERERLYVRGEHQIGGDEPELDAVSAYSSPTRSISIWASGAAGRGPSAVMATAPASAAAASIAMCSRSSAVSQMSASP